ncbi:bifunctional DNA-formamidopyrimidine glycosylase/DNA-(apurinic or apyrimidinic site) lyase [Alphaproteobacteria bacterium]|nr:bifunctional DNA-formamidopyrimidine glycosylase/DNA-(apurinic or apyrimidinic site) lyase [Alphaproteobacteria bacterium]
MPELPEVETTIKGLKPIVGSKIINIKINTPKLRYFIPKSILLINSVRITKIKRKGKFVIFYLQNKHSIVFHLGMSGRLRLYKKLDLKNNLHDHFLLETSNKRFLVFNDPRRFGFIDYDLYQIINSRNYLTSLGADALSPSLDGPYLFFKISKSIVPIKQILLNQKIISGIGNIYASEILFNAKISPLRRGKDLNLHECNKICKSSKKILKKSINEGGSTLRDYVATDGTLGNFQNNFKVYNREGEKISGKIVKKIIQYGRSTYFSPFFQK